MIEVIEKETNKKVTFGEIVSETENDIRVHSSSITFKKDTYIFLRKI